VAQHRHDLRARLVGELLLEQAHLGHETDWLRDRGEDAGDVEVAVVVGDEDVALGRRMTPSHVIASFPSRLRVFA
jgi:hypothetical protein